MAFAATSKVMHPMHLSTTSSLAPMSKLQPPTMAACSKSSLKGLKMCSGQRSMAIANQQTLQSEHYPENMACYQCSQTAHGKGCFSNSGVCGKQMGTSALQDLIVEINKEIGQLANAGKLTPEMRAFFLESMFSTLTNVNFDDSRMVDYIRKGQVLLAAAKGESKSVNDFASEPDHWLEVAETYSHAARQKNLDPDAFGLIELATYGIKGACAYMFHAEAVKKQAPDAYPDQEANQVIDGLLKIMAAMLEPTKHDLLALSLEVGALNVSVMKMLSDSHRALLGIPSPHEVSCKLKPGPCILVSGHDLADLKILLEQTEGKGVNIYTHGEMLPAHSYPELRKHKHLAGNWGGAWWEQHGDFKAFPGAILMTSNCLTAPTRSYRDRIFTAGPVGWDGIPHVQGHDFSQLVDCAVNKAKPATGDEVSTHPAEKVTVGFGYETVEGVTDTLLGAIKGGQLKDVFLVGGCDGREAGRSYFTDLVKQSPDSSVILTLGCGKFRFNDQELGNLGESGIPRLLDIGQCNDAYSAVVIANGLADKLNVKMSDLPLHFAISWLEQKAVAVLLSMLHLNMKNIYLGPNLPAFLTPNLVKALVDNYNLKLTGDAEKDLKEMLQ
ncbi:hypothetical protein GUITHDRAFT_152637 [Guillardia theta CCMP2712]|uniref:Hydroxylamine reductase n=1 Tax=Guillardia theta (strain CCMP2712) TaxID=905079 RepID=L1JAK1_GUITC|nr:hypothetical protein GUITHDRAFT_152637 [Guillardia theta CCMP2712]EKX45573.1 hypothetical protein GUITHDRAFT_152637 [Guillardia theta CCMP2712]|eukprot:XP_005832553.1 hypothetical protein GUITHDRAFT_152637 [Guillardia theta CCMP2712]